MPAKRTTLSLLAAAALCYAVVHAASPLAADSALQLDSKAAAQAEQDSDIIRSLLVGEFAVQSGDAELAWKSFFTAAQKGHSAEAAGRAFEIAVQADNEEAGKEALKLWTQLDPNNRQVRLEKVEKLFREGKYDEASALVKDLALESNDPAGELDALGAMQQAAPEKDKFYRAFVKAADTLKEDARAQLVLSELAKRASMTPQAAMHATKAMDLMPDSPHVVMRGIDAEFAQDPKKAVSRLQAFLKDHPDSFELRLAYAKALMRTGKTKELGAQLKRLEEGRRDDAHSMMLLGMIAEEAHLLDKAELYYKRYLVLLGKKEKTALLPDTAYVRLGMVKLAQGDKKEAIAWLDRVEGGDKYEAARIKEAELLAQTGDVDGACKVLRGIRTSDAKRKMSFDVACAELLLRKKDVNKAVDVLIETLAAGPKNPDLLYKTAIMATQQNRYADAEKLFERFIAENPDNPNGWNSLGFLWADRAVNLQKAETYLDKAMELSGGKDAFILDSLGWLRYRQGRLEEAEALIRKAQYNQPGDTEIALHLAEVLYVVGKTKEADSFIASVLEGEPNNAKAKELRAHKGPAK